MYEKTKQLNNCCFCFPLRRGLLTFGYARLILDALVAYNVISEIYRLSKIEPPDEQISYILIAAFFLIDAIFAILFIAAGHKKSRKLYRISNIYTITCVSLEAAYQSYDVVIELYHHHLYWNHFLIEDLLIKSAIVLAVVSVQIYVVLLTRKEMNKLQNLSQNMQFVNNKALEAEALCVHA